MDCGRAVDSPRPRQVDFDHLGSQRAEDVDRSQDVGADVAVDLDETEVERIGDPPAPVSPVPPARRLEADNAAGRSGMRMEPPMSEPVARVYNPATRAAPEPPDEPLGGEIGVENRSVDRNLAGHHVFVLEGGHNAFQGA